MMNEGEEGLLVLPTSYGRPGRCCCLCVLALLCGVLVLASYLTWRQFSQSFSPNTADTWLENDEPSSAPAYTDFIDPDMSYLPRMFYSGGLASRSALPSAASQSQSIGDKGVHSVVNVTVFTGREAGQLQQKQHLNACVPFHAPGNRTLRICVYEPGKDQMISSYLRDYGVWEKEHVEDMALLLRRDDAYLEREARKGTVVRDRRLSTNDHSRAGVTPGPGSGRQEAAWGAADRLSVVDVGCNVGVYTLAAASQGHQVLAIDPVQPSLQLLHTSLQLAGLRSSVTLLLNALSDHPGPVRVYVNPANVGGSFVSHRRPQTPQQQKTLPTVWALCLNHLVPLVPTRRLFLKLDIESWEARVLRCGADFFQQLDVRYVLMEWLFLRNSRSGAEVVDFFLRNGLLPYTDVRQTTMLSPARHFSWPDNVWWIKR